MSEEKPKYTEIVAGGIYAQVRADGTRTGHVAVCTAVEPGKHGRGSLFTFNEGERAPMKNHPTANEWVLLGSLLNEGDAESALDLDVLVEDVLELKARVEALEKLMTSKPETKASTPRSTRK